jgi:Zn-dependent protease/CBS domain-containing protein
MRLTGRGIRLFRAFGVSIHLDYSWFIFFVLVVWTFGHFYFPTFYPSFERVTQWELGIAGAILLFVSVVFHEMSHAVTSNFLGFPIRKITLFIFGGVAHMKSEPDNPKTEFIVAAAGPIATLILYLFFSAMAAVAQSAGAEPLYALMYVTARLNGMLALFNLVPGFPLDGGRLLRSLFWWKTGNLKRATNFAARLGEGFAYFIMAAGAVYLFRGDWVSALWNVLIGVFLKNAAEQSYQHVLIEDVLQGISVSEIMGHEVMTVNEEDSLARLVDQFIHHKFTAYPVLNREGFVVGVIDLEHIKGVPREQRDEKSALEVMHLIPLAHLPRPSTNAFGALREMLALGLSQLPVVDENGRLAGFVTRTDIMSMFQIRSDLADQLVV